jgi:tetratricopeptide (TPR) repeat protein
MRVIELVLLAQAALIAAVPLAYAETPSSKAPASLPLPAQALASSEATFSAPTPQLRAAYEAALVLTLKMPADPDTLFKFAVLAVKLGDMEGAISALERLLLIENDLPEVKLELGVLYYRIGANIMAVVHLEAAAASPSATPETRQRAGVFLEAAR